MRLIQSKRSEKSLVFHKTVLAAPRALYASVTQIDRRKAKGRNEKGKRKPDRSSQSLTCSTNRTPVLALYEAKPIAPPPPVHCLVSLRSTDIDYRLPRRLSLLPNTEKWTKAFARDRRRRRRANVKHSYRRGILSTRPTRFDGGPWKECSKFPSASGPPAFADGCN